MTDIRSCRDLVVWQKAMDLVERVYVVTRAIPREEVHGLTRGSLTKVETQLILAQRLDYLTMDSTKSLLDLGSDIGRLPNGRLRSLTTDH
jgi:hypothetical protein